MLPPPLAQAMVTPQIPGIDKEVGLHLFLLDEEEGMWGHSGSEQGVATLMGFHPATKVGVIIFTNQGEADLERLWYGAYQLGGKL